MNVIDVKVDTQDCALGEDVVDIRFELAVEACFYCQPTCPRLADTNACLMRKVISIGCNTFYFLSFLLSSHELCLFPNIFRILLNNPEAESTYVFKG